MVVKFGVFVHEDHSKLLTLYWLPKLHKRPYMSHFIANSSSCTTTEFSRLLTDFLTMIKNHVMKYCTTVYERNGKKYFGLLQIHSNFACNENGAFFTSEQSKRYKVWSYQKMCHALHYLLNNIFIRFCLK